jgi:hypothetical protein
MQMSKAISIQDFENLSSPLFHQNYYFDKTRCPKRVDSNHPGRLKLAWWDIITSSARTFTRSPSYSIPHNAWVVKAIGCGVGHENVNAAPAAVKANLHAAGNGAATSTVAWNRKM